MSNPAVIASTQTNITPAPQMTDLEALFNTSEYFDLSAMSPPPADTSVLPSMGNVTLGNNSGQLNTLENFVSINGGSSQQQDTNQSYIQNMDSNLNNNGMRSNGSNTTMGQGMFMPNDLGATMEGIDFGKFDFTLGQGNGGFGGEALAGEGMDTVSDGLKGAEGGQGL